MNDLITRYVAVWNEPDAELRRKAIAELWTEDGVQILQPPQEIREPAEALGLTPVLEARGHTALETRVARAYDAFVAPGEYTFRARPNADRLHNVIKFNWEMVPTSGGTPAAVGLEIFILAPDDRIQTDYQFIES
jgi:hypothetical protein